jgi:hypothetical protein
MITLQKKSRLPGIGVYHISRSRPSGWYLHNGY